MKLHQITCAIIALSLGVAGAANKNKTIVKGNNLTKADTIVAKGNNLAKADTIILKGNSLARGINHGTVVGDSAILGATITNNEANSVVTVMAKEALLTVALLEDQFAKDLRLIDLMLEIGIVAIEDVVPALVLFQETIQDKTGYPTNNNLVDFSIIDFMVKAGVITNGDVVLTLASLQEEIIPVEIGLVETKLGIELDLDLSLINFMVGTNLVTIDDVVSAMDIMQRELGEDIIVIDDLDSRLANFMVEIGVISVENMILTTGILQDIKVIVPALQLVIVDELIKAKATSDIIASIRNTNNGDPTSMLNLVARLIVDLRENEVIAPVEVIPTR